ncbi:MAG: Hsp20/alpha crystallin family protein [Chloroflexi bacterium]|nr:Hsp20/alpha crystallin family protein [Chloroflexota bacterium]
MTITSLRINLKELLRPHVWAPPTDVYETEDHLVVRIEIAGMEEDDFTIVVNGRSLLVRGVRLEAPERRAYHQMEIRFGEFISEVELPYNVVAEAAQAAYTHGILNIWLPKISPRTIPIEG